VQRTGTFASRFKNAKEFEYKIKIEFEKERRKPSLSLPRASSPIPLSPYLTA
jgi:hypothetical protein